MDGSALGLLGRRVDHNGRFVDGRNQLTQFLDRIVERIGDRAGYVFGYGRFHGQVAIGEAAHFVQQPQNSLLVPFVLFALVASLALEGRHANIEQDQRDHQDDREQDQSQGDPRARQYPRQTTAHTATTERLGKLVRSCCDLLLGRAETRQLSRVLADRCDMRLEGDDLRGKRLHDRGLVVRIERHDVERARLSCKRIAHGTQELDVLRNGGQHRAGVGIASQTGRCARDITRPLLHFLDNRGRPGTRKQLVGHLHDLFAGSANAAHRLDRRAPAEDRRRP